MGSGRTKEQVLVGTGKVEGRRGTATEDQMRPPGWAKTWETPQLGPQRTSEDRGSLLGVELPYEVVGISVVNPSLLCPSPWSAIKSTVFLNSGGRVNLWRKGQILPPDSAFSSENPYKLFNCHPPWSQSPSCGSQWDKKVCRHPYFQSWVKNSLFSVWQNVFWHIHCYHLTRFVSWVM